MTSPQDDLLAQLKALPVITHEFDAAEIWDDARIKDGKFRIKVLTAWQMQKALHEAHNYLVEYMSGQKDPDLKHEDLTKEHIRFAFVLSKAVVNKRGLPVFPDGKDILLVLPGHKLEVLFDLYMLCQAKDRNVPLARDMDSEFVLKISRGLADLDEAIPMYNRALEEDQLKGLRLKEEPMSPLLLNAMLARFSREEVDELLIRLSLMTKGAGLFDSMDANAEAYEPTVQAPWVEEPQAVRPAEPKMEEVLGISGMMGMALKDLEKKK